ncbi:MULTISPECIES: ATP-dependent DNA helicase UvrD2 [Brevibacterium]|uniref:DNA 3'-5' helicase n=1 Tax=Brevibacterium paucivorans TaxID=170994 RepID=A0A2N6VPL1_9MICO|nr:ATP-dependent DNA helicase UvrD2 [Brevibacterium paucivorans]MCG7298863.1 ATP-dependent DNA helicase UvrD2 [Brevibacterium sp. ACRRH]PMD06075.1 DNA helicase [Brevibacterium paucivorans]
MSELLDNLDPEQREVVTHEGGPLVVLAGAGTGKTRAITHRIAYGAHTGQLPAQHVLALTFTAKAAGEMRSRLRGLGVPQVQARTFHSAALRQLRYFWSEFAQGPFPELMDGKFGPLRRILSELGIEPERETIRDVAAELEYAAVNLVGIDDYPQFAQSRELPPGIDTTAMVAIMRAYADHKTTNRLIDYQDVLLILSGVMASTPHIAAKIHQQYRHFVVDEFQDVSPIQYELLKNWLGERDSLCVVGDPAQTIYTFAGARDSYLMNLGNVLPQARTISLVRNYRSTPPIVEAANKVLAHTGRNRMVLQPQRSGGVAPTFHEYPDDASEATGVAQRIAAQISSGVPASDIAILFRTNGQSPAFEHALDEHGIHYLVRGGEQFFARPEIRQAGALLRANMSQGKTGQLDTVVADLLTTLGWQEVGPRVHGAVRARWESLNALVNLAKQMQQDSDMPVPLSEFVAELEQRAEAQHAPSVQGVTLASVHAAKGLEWPHVYLVGMSEGLMPISYASTPLAVAEERRLFYVAVTRAQDTLTVSWSQARQASAQSTRKPSRFIGEMRGHTPTQRERRQQARASSTRACGCGNALVSAQERRNRVCHECSQAVDENMVNTLKEWRTQTARELDVPAYMVLTTATLMSIAQARPQSLDELGQVSGIGPVKLGQFGDDILEAVRSSST